MKTVVRTALAIALLVAGFAIGYPVGQNIGFSTGSEWALMQAELIAREAGMFMPVHYEDGMFRVKLKQPPQLHNRAWKLADKNYEEIAIGANCKRPIEKPHVTQSAYLTQ